MKRLAMLVAVSLASLVVSGKLSAQETGGGTFGGPCTTTWTPCSGDGHTASGGTDAGGSTHGECMTCVVNGVPGQDPWPCHSCDEGLNEQGRLAYREALKAAAVGNIRDLLKFSQRAGGHVMFNAERKMVQVSSCNHSSIIASFPLKNAADLRVAALLPSATQSSALGNTFDR